MAEAAEAVSVEVFESAEAVETPAPEQPTPEAKPDKEKPAKAAKEDKPDQPKEHEAPWLKEVFGGKYLTKAALEEGYAESSKEAREQAKAAKAAAEKLTEHEAWRQGIEPLVGAPVDEKGEPAPYDWGFPEGADVDPILVKLGENTLREMNLSNGAAQKLGGVLAQYEAARELGRREYERGRCVEVLGGGNEQVAEASANAAFKWAAAKLADDPAAIEDLKECGGVGAAVNTIARLQRVLSATNMGRSMGAGGISMATEAERTAAYSDPRYMKDQAYTDSVHAALNEAFAGGQPKEQDS